MNLNTLIVSNFDSHCTVLIGHFLNKVSLLVSDLVIENLALENTQLKARIFFLENQLQIQEGKKTEVSAHSLANQKNFEKIFIKY